MGLTAYVTPLNVISSFKFTQPTPSGKCTFKVCFTIPSPSRTVGDDCPSTSNRQTAALVVGPELSLQKTVQTPFVPKGPSRAPALEISQQTVRRQGSPSPFGSPPARWRVLRGRSFPSLRSQPQAWLNAPNNRPAHGRATLVAQGDCHSAVEVDRRPQQHGVSTPSYL